VNTSQQKKHKTKHFRLMLNTVKPLQELILVFPRIAPVWFIRENTLGKQQITNSHGQENESDRAIFTCSSQSIGSGLSGEVTSLLMVSRRHRDSGFPTTEPPRYNAMARQRAKEKTTMTATKGQIQMATRSSSSSNSQR